MQTYLLGTKYQKTFISTVIAYSVILAYFSDKNFLNESKTVSLYVSLVSQNTLFIDVLVTKLELVGFI